MERLALVLVWFSLWSGSAVMAVTRFPDSRWLQQQEIEYLTDFIEVKFLSACNESEMEDFTEQILNETGCSEGTRIYQHAGIHEEKHVAAGLHLWYTFDCESAAPENHTAGEGAQTAIARLQSAVASLPSVQHSGLFGMDVVSFSPDIVENVLEEETKEQKRLRGRSLEGVGTRILATSNDEHLPEQDNLNAISIPGAWDIMNEFGAWENAYKTVCHVSDSGWDMSHEDLGGNAWKNEKETCNTGSDDDGNGFVDDCHGYNHADRTGTDLLGRSSHGSHVSGIIAADTDNEVGVAGIAGGLGGSRGVSLMTGVIFGDRRRGFGQSIVYAADNGAHISSNSWGYATPGTFPQSLQDAIDYAVEAGVLVVFAAGNSRDEGNYYPGAYEKVIAVAATDNDHVAASFTTYGDWVDIAAPGVSIASTSTDNSYLKRSGTSMACPQVSAVLALGKSLHPDATAAELRHCLTASADDIDGLQETKYVGKLGAGMLNATAFLQCVSGLVTPAPTPSPVLPQGEPLIHPTCGNGILDEGEFCDPGLPIVSTSCEDLGFPEGGTPTCSNDCASISTTGCYKLIHLQTDVAVPSKLSIHGMIDIGWPTNYIRFETVGGIGDADLYIRVGKRPSPSVYDCRPYSLVNNEWCYSTGKNAHRGEYYWMIRAYKEFSGMTFKVLTDGEPPAEMLVDNEDST